MCKDCYYFFTGPNHDIPFYSLFSSGCRLKLIPNLNKEKCWAYSSNESYKKCLNTKDKIRQQNKEFDKLIENYFKNHSKLDFINNHFKKPNDSNGYLYRKMFLRGKIKHVEFKPSNNIIKFLSKCKEIAEKTGLFIESEYNNIEIIVCDESVMSDDIDYIIGMMSKLFVYSTEKEFKKMVFECTGLIMKYKGGLV